MKHSAILYITPQAKQSCRFYNRRAITDPKKKKYLTSLAFLAYEKKPERKLRGQLKMSVDFIWPFRKTDTGPGLIRKSSKPDIDNCMKPLQDALSAIWYDDDRQIVCYGECGKYYGPEACIRVTVEELEAQP